jgi:hypothetical protein
MNNRLRTIPLCLLALTMVTATAAPAQQSYVAGNEQIVAAAPLPQDQLDALLAPIALYPDQLLAQVLMASTYPNDVADAARFVRENPSLTGAALDQALQGQNWDPSVLSLAAYPQVLLMMNDMLDWTQRLGEAFLANQQQVMDTVQTLRARAEAAGHLQSTPQQTVVDQGGVIDIEPAQPQYVYVPVYDPTVIYGSWSDAYVPPYWYPPAIYGYPDFAPGFAVGLFFGRPCRVDYNHWGWARPNWRGHDIDINVTHNYFANRPQYADRWRDGHWAHSPEQHPSIGLRDNGSQREHAGNAAFQPRQPYSPRNSMQTQQPIAHPALQSRPFQQEVARPAPQALAFTRPQQWQQSYARPPQLQQSYVRPAQPQQPIARAMPPRPIARPMQQPQQGAWRGPQQAVYRIDHSPPRVAQTSARPLAQPPSRPSMTRKPFQPQQSFARPVPPPSRSFARSMPSQQSFARSVPPPSRQIASPGVQRGAPRVSYSQQPRAQTQANARHAEGHRS